MDSHKGDPIFTDLIVTDRNSSLFPKYTDHHIRYLILLVPVLITFLFVAVVRKILRKQRRRELERRGQ